VYYLALLRFVGCTADSYEVSTAVGGDEIAARAAFAPAVMGDMRELVTYLTHDLAAGSPLLTRLRLIAGSLAEGKRSAALQVAVHCEVAQMLADRIGLRDTVGRHVGATFERWDGKGVPDSLAGEAIPLPARIVSIARDVEVFHRAGGWDFARNVLQRRRGHTYDPAATDAFLSHGPEWLSAIDAESAWDAVLAAEPAPHPQIPAARLDAVLGAFADFVDIKSPSTLGHSTEVAELAAAAALASGLSTDQVRDVRHAGLLHDLGKTGIPNGIWDKPAALSMPEWERVRLHPYLTERILARAPALSAAARIAGAHHERLDGSGYHRGSDGAALPMAARILAAADVYQAMGQDRPHRPALAPAPRVAELRRQAADGRLDRTAVDAVLTAAGEAVKPARTSWPNGLTDREVEVLRLIARGGSNRDVARELVISPKTAGRHVENIYAKINVSSRASAALFALQNGLLRN
jgi:HD-GYP domain-containing protein (c-di-GMP phosphodiesterase class II)